MTPRMNWHLHPNRRRVLQGTGGVALAWLLAGSSGRAWALSGLTDNELGPAVAFSFEGLQRDAEQLAAKPYEPAVVPSPEVLAEITYDEYQRIRYRPDKSVRLGARGEDPVQFFDPANTRQSRAHARRRERVAREVISAPSFSTFPIIILLGSSPAAPVSPASGSWRTI